MPTIEIRITIPEGAEIEVQQVDSAPATDRSPIPDHVGAYWHQYLSDNGRRIFGAAADIQSSGEAPFSLEDVAGKLRVPPPTALSWYRTVGRTAKKWREQRDSQEPIRLKEVDYLWDEASQGMRTLYELPPWVAEQILRYSSS